MDWQNILGGIVTAVKTPAGIGWTTIVGGVILIGVWVANYFSPAQVNQRLRIERANLMVEKGKIESSQPTAISAARLITIESRLKQIDTILSNQ